MEPTRLSHGAAVFWVCVAVGVLLTFCDRYAHVQFGVLAYDEPAWNEQAWWVLPNFIAAALGMYLGAKYLFVRFLSGATRGEIAFSVAWFVTAYFATGFYWQHSLALATVLTVAWILRLYLSRDRAITFVYSIVLAVIGVLMEGSLSRMTGFAYAAPDFYNVPYWLPALYLNGAFLVLQIVYKVEKRYARAA